jgi:hypothetical protein
MKDRRGRNSTGRILATDPWLLTLDPPLDNPPKSIFHIIPGRY